MWHPKASTCIQKHPLAPLAEKSSNRGIGAELLLRLIASTESTAESHVRPKPMEKEQQGWNCRWIEGIWWGWVEARRRPCLNKFSVFSINKTLDCAGSK